VGHSSHKRMLWLCELTTPKKYNKTPDFRGMVISTIRGYTYPSLEPYFEKEQLIRYDISNLQVNLIRLELNRIDALVDAEMLINYQLQ